MANNWNVFAINSSQLAKMKKSIPDMALHYDFCEYVEFGAISWKFDILSITA